MRNTSLTLFLALIPALFLTGCGEPENPLDVLRSTLDDESAYSIMLEDMRQEGSLFPKQYHKYEVATDLRSFSTDWYEVPENLFTRYLPFLGMVVWMRNTEWDMDDEYFEPPGFSRIGKKKYGKWVKKKGKDYWNYHPQYGHYTRMLGGRAIGRDSYKSYSMAHKNRTPFFGMNKQYGTGGSLTRKMFPGYFTRKATAASAKTGRTNSSMRSRSTGRGK